MSIKPPRWGALLVLMALVTFILVLAAPILYRSFPDSTQRSSIGDMFGGFNALFSGLAFAGVIYALLLQRAELESTRDELKRTSDVQAASVKALERQAQYLFLAARMTAISARIDGLNKQIAECAATTNPELQARVPIMQKQRHNLYVELDKAIIETQALTD